jgi:hypothetical protein
MGAPHVANDVEERNRKNTEKRNSGSGFGRIGTLVSCSPKVGWYIFVQLRSLIEKIHAPKLLNSKSQNTNSKQITMTEIQNPKLFEPLKIDI